MVDNKGKLLSLQKKLLEMKERENEEEFMDTLNWEEEVEVQLADYADILCLIGNDIQELVDENERKEARLFDLEREVEELRSIINKLIRGLRTSIDLP